MRIAPALLLLLASLPVGATTVYNDLAAWQTVVGEHELETFNGGGVRTVPLEGGYVDGPATDMRYWAERNTYLDEEELELYDCPGIVISSLCGPSENNQGLPWVESRIEFGASVWAFGFEGFTTGTGGPSAILVGGERYEFADEVFLGLVLDAPITGFDFEPAANGWSIDNLRFATTIPEPSTGLLVALGLLALRAERKRSTCP